MKKLIFFSFLFISSLFATRMDDSIKFMQKYYKHGLFLKAVNNSLNVLNISDYKIYKSKHFKIYYGNEKVNSNTLWADYNGDNIPDIITFTANTLEYVYNKEINEFNFSKPIGTIPIDVYFANTGLKIDGKKLTASDNICGFSVWTGKQSFIVINSDPPYSPYTSVKDTIKITLAHEFFHLVQYNYKLDLDDFNIWMYEGTAVLMEHLVYPKIPDYIYSYSSTLLNNPQNGFILDYGLIPYSSSLFFNYIVNKYGGVKFLKKIWEDFAKNDCNSVCSINKTLKEYNSSIYKETYDFYKSLDTNKSYLSNKSLISSIQKTILQNYKTKTQNMYIFGALITKNTGIITQNMNNQDSYLISNSKILNSGLSNTDDNISVLVPNNLYKSYFYNVDVNYTLGNLEINLTKGWNLITGDINLTNLNNHIKIIWTYKNDKWQYFSKEFNLSNFKIIKNLNVTDSVWIYTDKNSSIKMKQFNNNINWSLKKGWNFISLPIERDLDLNYFKKYYIIWYWDNGWYYASDKVKLDYPKLKKLYKKKGFWIWGE